MHRLMRVAIAAVIPAAFACGGGSNSYSSVAPSATPAPASSAPTTIAIVGTSGTQAYNPNPVQVPDGGQVVFRNQDTRTHHIVMDDGSADVGTIAPGASSNAMPLKSGSYHCTIHPSMVGSINGQAPTAPTCPNGYCG